MSPRNAKSAVPTIATKRRSGIVSRAGRNCLRACGTLNSGNRHHSANSTSGWPFRHRSPARVQPTAADRRLCPGLCHRDVCDRSDHCRAALRPVLDPAFAGASRDCERISIHRAIIIPWLLTLPGVFAPGGLLGAGLQSTIGFTFCGLVAFQHSPWPIRC
jgi:hypothetical protein